MPTTIGMNLLDFYAHADRLMRMGRYGWAIVCKNERAAGYITQGQIDALEEIRNDSSDQQLVADLDKVLDWCRHLAALQSRREDT
jgi:hypothetical protein